MRGSSQSTLLLLVLGGGVLLTRKALRFSAYIKQGKTAVRILFVPCVACPEPIRRLRLCPRDKEETRGWSRARGLLPPLPAAASVPPIFRTPPGGCFLLHPLLQAAVSSFRQISQITRPGVSKRDKKKQSWA